MPLRVTELRMPIDGDEGALIHRALRTAGLHEAEVEAVELVRKSVDKRRRTPELVYSFDLHLKDAGVAARVRPSARVRWVDPEEPALPARGSRRLGHRPVVVGAGPAGLFAALALARAGFSPLVLERGSRMNLRVRQVESFHRGGGLLAESNYLFGEGGAGTFSDGKLTSRSKDPRVRIVLREFREKSGLDPVGYYYRPHLGSDRVRAVVGKIRREVELLGGAFSYDHRVDRLLLRDGAVRGVATSQGEIAADCVVLAPGHSARDLYRALLDDGLAMERKPFQLGFRVEHPQGFVDERVYGGSAAAARLGPADYRMVTQAKSRGVFSFCMCPGGEIIPAISDAEHYNTNGMSYFHKDTGFANSGVVTTIEPEEFGGDHPLAGIAFQEAWERKAGLVAGADFALPAQRLRDFMAGRPSDDVPRTSCRTPVRPTDVAELAAPFVVEAIRAGLARFEGQMPGYLRHPDALICGPESRSSAPVRILRDPATLVAAGADGVFPVGEGAGYAGGIVSAAVDGWRAAEAIVARHAPAPAAGS